jgi:hypothetical protein
MSVATPTATSTSVTSLQNQRKVPVARLVALTTTATAQPNNKKRMIRVGLSTTGGPIVMLSSAQIVVTDGGQVGRRLVVPAGQTVSFSLGAPQTMQARGETWDGPVLVRTASGSYAGWRVVKVQVAKGETSIATDSADPRGRRAYRGDFEIVPQTFSFEPAMHRSPLRLVNVLLVRRLSQRCCAVGNEPDRAA